MRTHENPSLLQGRAPKRRDCRLDYSGRNPRAVAEMPDVPGGIRGDLDWDRALVLSRDTFASGTCDSVRRIDFVCGGEKRASPDSQI
jgi:hypothetical protein